MKKISEENHQRGAKRTALATEPILALPEGWAGGELTAVFDDPMDSEQRFAVAVAWRDFGGQRIFASLALPESMARAAPGLFEGILAVDRPVLSWRRGGGAARGDGSPRRSMAFLPEGARDGPGARFLPGGRGPRAPRGGPG